MTILLAIFLLTPAHLDALYLVESGGLDRAIGASGEVSRYQIMPQVWRQYARRGESPRNPLHARNVATRILSNRIRAFESRVRRRASDAEIYLLWHRPARVLAPRPRERARAARFAAIVRELTP